MSSWFCSLLAIYTATSVIGVIEGASDGYDCSDAQLSKCVSTDNINNLRLISNQEELDSLCGANFNERLRCIDNYTRNCMDNDQRSHFNKIYSESTMVIQEICADGGEYRKEFLKHSPCLKSNQAAYEACATGYSKSLEEIKNSVKAGAPPRDHVKILCCSLEEYMKCSTDSVTSACGPETARFASAFLTRMVSGLLENHCQAHEIDQVQCSEMYANARSSFFSPSYLLILLSFLVITQ